MAAGKKSESEKATPASLADILGNNKNDSDSTVEDDNTPDVADTSDTDVDYDEKFEPELSEHVVSTVPNKTPEELASESADETAARYNIDTTITDEDAANPRVQVYEDTHVRQVPSGTHLHPDVAKSLQHRGISENTTDSAQVKRTVTETYDFAPDAEFNDKF